MNEGTHCEEDKVGFVFLARREEESIEVGVRYTDVLSLSTGVRSHRDLSNISVYAQSRCQGTKMYIAVSSSRESGVDDGAKSSLALLTVEATSTSDLSPLVSPATTRSDRAEGQVRTLKGMQTRSPTLSRATPVPMAVMIPMFCSSTRQLKRRVEGEGLPPPHDQRRFLAQLRSDPHTCGGQTRRWHWS